MGLKPRSPCSTRTATFCFRRTLVGLKQPAITPHIRLVFCFRRTLVGLKRPIGFRSQYRQAAFQTNPCGVEATTTRHRTARSCPSFRRTLVGLKHRQKPTVSVSGTRFRRTLVGLKQRLARQGVKLSGCFRRTLVGLKQPMNAETAVIVGFQTNPCGVEASRSFTVSAKNSRFRRTLVGLKRCRRLRGGLCPAMFQTNPCGVEAVYTIGSPLYVIVSDEPLWG